LKSTFKKEREKMAKSLALLMLSGSRKKSVIRYSAIKIMDELGIPAKTQEFILHNIDLAQFAKENRRSKERYIKEEYGKIKAAPALFEKMLPCLLTRAKKNRHKLYPFAAN
jgi:hypothetical protein